MAQAVALFHAKKTNPNTGKLMSMQKLCQLVSDDHYEKTHERIPVDDSTLARLDWGGVLKQKAMEKRADSQRKKGTLL